jgi:predicted metal-binding membrane protein
MPEALQSMLAGRREPRRDLALVALLGGLALAAWAALWAWSASPYARYVAHDGWLETGALAALCRAVPGGSWLVPAALYALSWVLMIAAMMLPTTYPVLGIFRVMTRSRADAGRLIGLIVAGFFCAWFAFGLAAHALDAALAWAGGRDVRVAGYAWMAGATVLAAAGGFSSPPSSTAASSSAARRSPSSRRAGTVARRRARPCASASTTVCSASAAAGR